LGLCGQLAENALTYQLGDGDSYFVYENNRKPFFYKVAKEAE